MGFRVLKYCNTASESAIASKGTPRDTLANVLLSSRSAKNYRLVSLISVPGKVTEQIFLKTISKHKAPRR